MTLPTAKRGVSVRRWWALLRGPEQLPVLFQTREQAKVNRDPDEYMARVWVVPANVRDRAKRKRRNK